MESAPASLRAVAALGDFFDQTQPAPPGALTLGGFARDPAAIRAAIDRTRATLGARAGLAADAIDGRAAASWVHLGLVARIVSPVLGASALLGTVPFRAEALVVHRTDAGRLILSAARGDGTSDVIHVVDILGELGAGFRAASQLSPIVMWGSCGSAIASAVAIVTRALPGHALAGRSAADDLLARPELRPTGAYVDGAWRRTSCCLYYRIPGGGLCGDCVLNPS